MSVSSRFKVTKIIGQRKRKAFYRHRIPKSSCARKETVDIDILITSRNGHRKIMQSIRITSRPTLRKRKWNQLSQFWRTSTKVIPIVIPTVIPNNTFCSFWFTLGLFRSPFQSFWLILAHFGTV